MAFGDRLREAREQKGLTRRELANKLGVTISAIGNYETGVSSPKEDILLKIFNVLSIEPNYLFKDSFIKSDITPDEAEIIKSYRSLNKEGQEKVADYTSDLVDTGKYKKLNESLMGEETKKQA